MEDVFECTTSKTNTWTFDLTLSAKDVAVFDFGTIYLVGATKSRRMRQDGPTICS